MMNKQMFNFLHKNDDKLVVILYNTFINRLYGRTYGRH